jgi:hypothetical protein
MLMRYHWGLGVGHTYAYRKEKLLPITRDLDDTSCQEEMDCYAPHEPDLALEGSKGSPLESDQADSDDDDYKWDEDVDSYSEVSWSDDEEAMAMVEMYYDREIE